MRLSQLFGRTLREPPADAELVSHQLAVRAGLVRFLSAGVYSLLPLGRRVVRKIEAIMREEMEGCGAQEILMPVLWQATGRCGISSAPSLVRLQDRAGRDYALAMTKVVVELARREVQSYRDLPRVIYHIQTRVCDEPRPRGGLLRAREFLMKDAYSLHTDAADLDAFYPKMLAAYRRIFARCNLAAIPVEADTGMMGGADSHEFMLPHPAGEDTLIRCVACGYAANGECAVFRLPPVMPQPLEQPCPIATPGCATIADVAAFVGVPTSRTLKAVFYAREPVEEDGEAELVFVVIRGDLEVNETKLRNVLGSGELRPATAEEIRAAGAEPGYASPVGLSVRSERTGAGTLVVADRSIEVGSNFVAGANRAGYHLTGVNYGRDFAVTLLADIAQAQAGHLCARCGGTLTAETAIKLGHCFKLGTHYSEPLGATYLDAGGETRPVVMGYYGISIGRLMAAVIESHHDEHGIVWPAALAPFDIHLVALATEGLVRDQAEALYARLQEAGFDVLYDDRNESAGVKFTDADLIGCPVRVTVSTRSLKAGGFEIKLRPSSERTVVPPHEIVSWIKEHIRLETSAR